ncbi:MAG: hypothetical protein RBG13Loki_0026 [Promethearchaeota archaeon CR_4]|nr:MAG: hypothetical protein RBG13Loki_0026 [Candidatus Lokiarchaeota archaeon CR_4]
MPTAAHIFIGLVAGLLLYQVSQKKFTAYHVILFTIQNIVGPDFAFLFPDPVDSFFHNAFGFMILAFGLAIPYLYLGRALKISLRYSDVYKVTAAGGLIHTCIDGFGHWSSEEGLGSFHLFSFDATEFFFQTLAGIVIFIGAIGLLVVGIWFTYNRFHRGLGDNRKVVITNTINAIFPYPVVMGTLFLARLMPFGDARGFSLVEAISATNIGEPGDRVWIYVISVLFLIITLLAVRKAPRWELPLFTGFAAIIFLVLAIVPTAGGGEADLGVSYIVLLSVAVPALLLGTSYRKENLQ